MTAHDGQCDQMLELKVAQKVIKAIFTLIKSLFGGYICYNLYHKNVIKSIENRPIWHKSPNLTQIAQSDANQPIW